MKTNPPILQGKLVEFIADRIELRAMQPEALTLVIHTYPEDMRLVIKCDSAALVSLKHQINEAFGVEK